MGLGHVSHCCCRNFRVLKGVLSQICASHPIGTMLPVGVLGVVMDCMAYVVSASGATAASKPWGAPYEEAIVFVAVGRIADCTCCWRRHCQREACCTYERISRHRDFSACHTTGIEAAGTPARRRHEDGAVPLVPWIARFACVARFALFFALTNRQRHEEALISVAAGCVAGGAFRRRRRGQCEARHAGKHISADRSVVTGHANSRETVGVGACEELIFHAVR
jgi:hypothetical protein